MNVDAEANFISSSSSSPNYKHDIFAYLELLPIREVFHVRVELLGRVKMDALLRERKVGRYEFELPETANGVGEGLKFAILVGDHLWVVSIFRPRKAT